MKCLFRGQCFFLQYLEKVSKTLSINHVPFTCISSVSTEVAFYDCTSVPFCILFTFKVDFFCFNLNSLFLRDKRLESLNSERAKIASQTSSNLASIIGIIKKREKELKSNFEELYLEKEVWCLEKTSTISDSTRGRFESWRWK